MSIIDSIFSIARNDLSPWFIGLMIVVVFAVLAVVGIVDDCARRNSNKWTKGL